MCLPLAAAAHNRLGSVYGRRAAPLPKAMNIFNALGSIAFAYNFTGGANISMLLCLAYTI
jgi:hypothetical protein